MKLLFAYASIFFAIGNSYLFAEERIRVGVSVPITGGATPYGTDILNGIQFANRILFKDKYDLVIENDECSAKDALNVARKLISLDRVNYVLGFGCSSAVLSAAPLYEKNKVVAIAAGTTAPEISNAGKYIFRTMPSSDSGASLLYDWIVSRHKKLGVISEQTDYAQGVLQGLLKAQKTNRSTEIIESNYLPSEIDFRSILLQLKGKDVDGIMLNPQSEEKLIIMVRQLHELGLKLPVYGFIYPSSPTFLSSVGNLAHGIIFADTPSPLDIKNHNFNSIINQFRRDYGEVKSSEFYVLTSILSFQALDQAINSGADVQEHLSKNSFSGINGEFSFDENGDLKGFGFILKTIRYGKVEQLNHLSS